MKRIRFACCVILSLLFFGACKCTKTDTNMNESHIESSSELKGVVAGNYFVRNDFAIHNHDEEFVITTQSDFDACFSPAAIMGKDGEPTKIDFNTQIAFCVVLDETDILKKLDFIDMTCEDDGKVICNYRLTTGRKKEIQSDVYPSRPQTGRPCVV